METQIVFDKRSISPGSVRCAEFSCSDPFVSLMANKSDQGKLKKKKSESRLGLAEESPEQPALLLWKSDLCRHKLSEGWDAKAFPFLLGRAKAVFHQHSRPTPAMQPRLSAFAFREPKQPYKARFITGQAALSSDVMPCLS